MGEVSPVRRGVWTRLKVSLIVGEFRCLGSRVGVVADDVEWEVNLAGVVVLVKLMKIRDHVLTTLLEM